MSLGSPQEYIRDLKRFGYTHQKIANELVLSIDTIDSWNIGRRHPTPMHLDNLIDLWKRVTQGPPEFVKMKWKWEQDDGSISFEDLYIPMRVWKGGVNAIGEWVTDFFARRWSLTRKDPSQAYGYYFVGHLAGFTNRIRVALITAYERKKK